MEWIKIHTSNELVRVATDEIAYVEADGNYSDMMLYNGKSHKFTFQLHYLESYLETLRDNFFVRVGRSLIVNKKYIFCINISKQELILGGLPMQGQFQLKGLPKEALKKLKELIESEKEGGKG